MCCHGGIARFLIMTSQYWRLITEYHKTRLCRDSRGIRKGLSGSYRSHPGPIERAEIPLTARPIGKEVSFMILIPLHDITATKLASSAGRKRCRACIALLASVFTNKDSACNIPFTSHTPVSTRHCVSRRKEHNVSVQFISIIKTTQRNV